MRVSNELLKPYSAKSYKNMSHFIAFKANRSVFYFDDYNKSGGTIFL